MSNIEKLNKLSEGNRSIWFEEAKKRQENKDWLYYSSEIALRVISELKNTNRTQADLAKEMGVSPQSISKLLKGCENLSLKTISRLEKALNIKLIQTISEKEIPKRVDKIVGTRHYSDGGLSATYVSEPTSSS